MTAATPLQRSADPITDFLSAMAEAGIGTKDKLAPDGRLHRFHVEGDTPGSKNGWYCLFLDGIAAGSFGSWKTGHKQKWCSKAEVQLTAAEREQRRAYMEAASRQRREEQDRKHPQGRPGHAEPQPSRAAAADVGEAGRCRRCAGCGTAG